MGADPVVPELNLTHLAKQTEQAAEMARARASVSAQNNTQFLGNRHAPVVMIFGHHMGSGPEAWLDLCTQWHMKMPYIRFILPRASNRTIAAYQDQEATAWYDIPKNYRKNTTFTPAPGIEESKDIWEGIIKEEVDPDTRVILAGFSHGAAMALYVAHTVKIPNLIAVVSMDGYLPPVTNVQRLDAQVYMCHGSTDDVIPIESGIDTYKILCSVDTHTDFKEFNVGHTVCEEECRDITRWLKKNIPSSIKMLR